MRKAGRFYNGPAVQLGKIMTDGRIKIGDLQIQKEDYLLDCNLRMPEDENIYIHTEMTDSVTNLKEYKNNILQEGDRVLIIKLEEKFVIIAKVVNPE